MAIGTAPIEDRPQGTGTDPPRLVVIEDNPLTAWAIEQTLSPTFRVIQRSTLQEAAEERERFGAAIVICGSPYADERPDELLRFVEAAGGGVIALVSDPDCRLSARMPVLEKPFELARLLELLAPARRVEKPEGGTVMSTIAQRLQARFKEEVCPRCIHRTADGGCTLTEEHECPVFQWAQQLAEVVEGIDSGRLADYMDKIQAIICPSCMQLADGRCKTRDRLDCPLDLYLGLVVPIIEEELARRRSRGSEEL